MKHLPKVSKYDQKFMKVDADPGFSPERNKRIIEETIKHNDELFIKNQKEYYEQTKQRTEALSYFLKGVDNGGKTTDIEKYFGPKELARLRGEQILNQLKAVRTPQGKIIRNPNA